MALGLGNRIAALSAPDSGEMTVAEVQERLRRRAALQSLIDPTGLGNFGVLIQGKGLSLSTAQTSLKGFQIPQMSGRSAG